MRAAGFLQNASVPLAESSKIPTSLMTLIYRRALFAQRFNATTAAVMAL
jgi:hypothetical protein